jgi:hypothetical protein
MAARIEFEREWNPKLKKGNIKAPNNTKVNEKKAPIKTKALGNIQSNSLKNMLDNL